MGAGLWEPELQTNPAALSHQGLPPELIRTLFPPFNSQRADASIKKMPLPCGLLHHNSN